MLEQRFLPHEVAMMHIDVQGVFANNNGTHHKDITRCVDLARKKGCHIIAVTFDDTRRCQFLPAGHRERHVSLVPVHEDDYAIRKSKMSALGEGGGNDLRSHLRGLKARGLKAVTLTGYNYDQCVWETARSLVNIQLGLAVHAVHSLCRPEKDNQDFDAARAFKEIGATTGGLKFGDGQVIISLDGLQPMPVLPATARPTPAKPSLRERVAYSR